LISIFAIWLGRRSATIEFSYGWHRAEVISALVSIFLLWSLTLWLLFEAVKRLIYPRHIHGIRMVLTSLFALFCNIFKAYTLHKNVFRWNKEKKG